MKHECEFEKDYQIIYINRRTEHFFFTLNHDSYLQAIIIIYINKWSEKNKNEWLYDIEIFTHKLITKKLKRKYFEFHVLFIFDFDFVFLLKTKFLNIFSPFL